MRLKKDIPKARIVVFAQTPPPEHGQSRMVASMLELIEGREELFTVAHVNARFSLTMDEIGDSSFRKLFPIVRYLFEALVYRFQIKRPILYYIPGPVKWSSVLRDWILLFILRPAYRRVLFHWHAIGQGEWAGGSDRQTLPGPQWLDALARRISAYLLGKPFASFSVSSNSLADALAVRSTHVHVVSNGIPDPCPEYETSLRHAREERQSEISSAGDHLIRLLFLSHGSVEKGLTDVLEAVKVLLTKSSQNPDRRYKLTLAGGVSGECRILVDALSVELLGIGGDRLSIHEVGFVTGNEKRSCFEQNDVFIAASRWESFGLVVAEAMAYGMPIVASASDGVSGVLPEDYVYLSPIRNPLLLASDIEKVCGLLEQGKSLELTDQLRGRFCNHFTLDQFEKDITEKLFAIATGYSIDDAILVEPLQPTRLKVVDDARDAERASIRVLQVFNQYAEQGGEEVWVDQVTSLSDKRLHIHELRFQSRAWKMEGAPSRVRQAMRMWDNPESRLRLDREVRLLDPDVLLFHNLIPVGSFGLYDEARRLDVPVLQYIHNFRPFSPSGTLWVRGRVKDDALHGNPWPEVVGRAWERSFMKSGMLAFHLRRLQGSGWLDAVDQWIAISEFMREKFVEAGIPESRITTLRHCWTPLPEEPSKEDRGYYLFLGRLVPEKGVRTLVEAWAKLEGRLGPSCPKLIIAGSGPEESRVQAATRGGKVEFAGFVSGEAKHRLLSGCRAVLAPSIWWEPLGLIVYEAYDHGKPVIAARSGGLVETVREGEGGFLHVPGNPDSLVEAILKLEDLGEAGRMEMGHTGRRWLLNKASPEAWKRDFEKIVRSVTS